MRNSRLLVAILLVAACWSAYDWIVVSEGVSYFTERHRRIWLLIGIVAAGTPLLLLYRSLPTPWKRRVTLWSLGGLATGASVFAGHIVYSACRLLSSLRETHMFWIVMTAGVSPIIVAGCLWWAFSRVRSGKVI